MASLIIRYLVGRCLNLRLTGRTRYTGTRAHSFGSLLRFSPSCSPSRSFAAKRRGLTPLLAGSVAGGGGGGRGRARASGSASRGGAGGLPLEAVEALEAAACVARDDGGGAEMRWVLIQWHGGIHLVVDGRAAVLLTLTND